VNRNQSICLVSPPKRTTSRLIPNALISLAAWLDKEGIPNSIVDIKREPTVQIDDGKREEIIGEILAEIKARKPTYVGLPCYSPDYYDVMDLAKRIKIECSPLKIIVGGIHATVKPQDFVFPDSPVDYAVVGEGEETLVDLIRRDLDGGEIGEVAGLAFCADGEFVLTSERNPMNLELLPMPAYQKIDMQYYLKPTRYLIRLLLLSGVSIFTTRGCPFQCTFCANRMRRVRFRPVELVLDEIEWLKDNYSIDSFYVQDDTFCLKEKRVFEFVEGLKQRTLQLVWGAETRVDLLTESILSSMKKAGCIQIDLGVESGSQKALDRMRKNIKVEEIKSVFKMCRKYGVRTFATVMLNTPDETEDDVRLTRALMRDIKATNYGLNLTVPFIGTNIYEEFVRPELTVAEYWLYDDPDLYHSIKDPRFRLAAHNLDLTKLYMKTLLEFQLWRSLLDVTTSQNYWRAVLNSKRRGEYIWAFMQGLYRQMKTYLRYAMNFLRKRDLYR